MIKLPLIISLILLSSLVTNAQGTPDACHVYLIDEKIAERALDKYIESKNEKEQQALLSAGVTILGKFSTVHGEEQLTTRAFSLPGSNLFATASVYYTDEIMPTKHGASMTLGLSVSTKPQKNALAFLNNTSAEVPDSADLDIIRVKQNVRVNGRSYLIGLQCERPQNPSSDK